MAGSIGVVGFCEQRCSSLTALVDEERARKALSEAEGRVVTKGGLRRSVMRRRFGHDLQSLCLLPDAVVGDSYRGIYFSPIDQIAVS